MRLAAIFCLLGWTAISFSKVPVYIAEITPKTLRGGLTTVSQRLRGKDADISEEAAEIEESQVSMSIVDALLMDKWGWRQLLMVSATGTCIGCLLTSISFILKDYESLQNWSPILALSGILVYTALVELGMAGIPWIIMAEIFPINVKGTAGSLVTLVHWFCSWIITFNYIFFMSWNKAGSSPLEPYGGWWRLDIVYDENIHTNMINLRCVSSWKVAVSMCVQIVPLSVVGLFFIFTGFSGATVLFVKKLVPETKGRTLKK
ncbi:hypothetical protein AMTR_s00019p00256240 [Amborella trichopoda]|uniref:Major facilitator superfamily (MFS) profile domain-containing protein n=1 Tax=Amborella trichopoda TaxID=13333 RepID=W1PC32_AMBTC|nr:hypothetical protein AMTR_s00019p00256240 [Amborella trichopoda]